MTKTLFSALLSRLDMLDGIRIIGIKIIGIKMIGIKKIGITIISNILTKLRNTSGLENLCREFMTLP